MIARAKVALHGLVQRLHHAARSARRLILWPFTPERLVSIAAVVTILGVPVAIYQLWDLHDQRAARSLNVLMYADQQLNTGTNVKIRHAIQQGRRLLEENEGHFTREQLGDYLDVFEALSDAYSIGLIDRDSLYIWHSYHMIRAFENDEVRRFVKEEQKDDAAFYAAFEEVSALMLQDEKVSGTAKREHVLRVR